MDLIGSIEERVQLFLIRSPEFQRVCKEAFESCGGQVSRWEAYAIVLVVFAKLREPLDRFGLFPPPPHTHTHTPDARTHARTHAPVPKTQVDPS